MSCPALPEELVDAILQHLDISSWFGRRTLTRSSLVCRIWAVTAQRRLFQTLTVKLFNDAPDAPDAPIRTTALHTSLLATASAYDGQDSRRICRFIEFLQTSPHLAGQIRCLSLQDMTPYEMEGLAPAYTAEELHSSIQLLPALRSLTFENVVIPALLPTSTLWQSLHVDKFKISAPLRIEDIDILNVLALFGSVHALTLHDIEVDMVWVLTDADNSLLPRSSIRPTTLRLVDASCAGLLLDSIQGIGALASVRYLDVTPIETEHDLVSVASVLQVVEGANCLTRLGLDGGSIFSSFLNVPYDQDLFSYLHMDQATSLRHLTVRNIFREDVSAGPFRHRHARTIKSLSQFFSSCDRLPIEHIVLGFSPGLHEPCLNVLTDGADRIKAVRALDSHIAKIPTLRTVTIVERFWASVEPDRAALAFPELEKRGIIRYASEEPPVDDAVLEGI